MHAPTFDFSPQIAKNKVQHIGTYAERKKNMIFGENHILSRETQILINSYFKGRKLNIISKLWYKKKRKNMIFLENRILSRETQIAINSYLGGGN